MYAVIRTGGKQYRVAPDDILEIEKLDAPQGDVVELDDVLIIGKDGEAPQIGTPAIDGARVRAEVLEQGRGEKIIVFKKKRRQNYRRKNGHRQHLTTVRVLEVLGAGDKAKAVPGEGVKKTKAKPGQGAKSREAISAKEQAESATEAKPAKSAAKAADKTQAKESAKSTAKTKTASSEKPAKSKAKAKAAAFKKLDAPQGEPDNLKSLPGVGPKLAEKLNHYGIFHFHQLAAMGTDDVKAMDEALDLKGRAERDDWVNEAKKLLDEQ